ncbi:hypothetical protein DRQ50_06150 [bacterium]|nr:MAG: hypothetical protein DRQ50_06150 [bacterium]
MIASGSVKGAAGPGSYQIRGGQAKDWRGWPLLSYLEASMIVPGIHIPAVAVTDVEGVSVMRLVKSAVLLIVLLGLAACSYVEGNYPEPKTKPPELPQEWKNSENESIMIWERVPEWRGFFSLWIDTDEALPMVEMGAAAGDRRAVALLDEIKQVNEDNLAIFNVALFLSKDAELRVTKGRLTIQFSDGTSTQDEGLSFLEMHKKGPRLHTTLSSAQTIKGKYAEKGKPLFIRIYVPKSYAGKTVRTILMR